MTGRSRGAPGPVGRSNPKPNPGERQVFPDLGAVRRSDAVLDALAARRAGHPIDDEDPAARLLRALIADIDGDTTTVTAPGMCGSSSGQVQGGGHHAQPRRRGPRTIVALSVVGAVLTSTGVAAAAGAGLVEQLMPGQSAQEKASEAADAYKSSRDELNTARQALARGNYDSARDSLDRARRGRSDLSGTQALDLDRQIRDLENDLDDLLPDVGAKLEPQPDPGQPRPTPRPRKPAPGGGAPVSEAPFPRTDNPAAPGVPAPSSPSGSVEQRKEEIRKRTRERIEKYRDWRER